ncbi:MAG TPA: 16S rRNA (guanine(966)-N(2))-methyltransferase RsmD [Novimethylophilus sp.]|uniref:16S rRNA (guanine(966)-N(2))-methyltransferase RsmD n=1 Tax=Novimethylophilus sp. TaxID=2137426 RepID=UPI002F3E5398
MAQTQNKVRIGAGVWRSRLLRFPDALSLRPTPDRVRQTLFNWLGQELHGLICLDLFAGSGALGFEALSRGAATAVMVENNPAVYRALLDNADVLKADKASIVRADAVQFLMQNARRFDVIFLDPPYGQGWQQKLLPRLAGHLAADGVVYAEAETMLADANGWQVVKHGKAGNVHYHLLKLMDGSSNAT